MPFVGIIIDIFVTGGWRQKDPEHMGPDSYHCCYSQVAAGNLAEI
jgi:hypothetical protein